MTRRPVYVMVDVEASGSNVNNNCLLSWAACVVTEEDLSNEELKARGLVYYDELKPLKFGEDHFSNNGPFFKSRGFVRGAMEVGCLGLRCLEKFGGDLRYHPASGNKLFQPGLVLKELEKSGTDPQLAVYRFKKWLRKIAGENGFVILGSDTSLFDLPWIKYYFDIFGRGRDILGHGGYNLHSNWMGLKRKRRVKKKQMGVLDNRVVAHCAEDDAIYLAKLARVAIYINCK
ncbi:MAG: hypothetical protein HY226_02855 [Candidatus Vogelbacteria bacterium]|nr:hypothetical protein [Candidatus Vogelbacteria bacterium]